MPSESEAFRPALVIVDVQEDFCPPNGALAVPDGRAILPIITTLLTLPFPLKVATKDHHPPHHVSFASTHNLPPFTSTITLRNPRNPRETHTTPLWPDHCVQGTPGNALLPEIERGVDRVVEKATDPDVEMFSAFKAPFRDPPLEGPGAVSELAGVLREQEISDVVVVGLAGDYCVKATAVDAVEEGWRTWIVEEGVRCVGGEEAWGELKRELGEKGVQIVRMDWVKEKFPEHF